MKILKNYYPVFIIVIIAVVISILNYTPETFLSGWDTLHPEFNFGLNLKRILFGVFRSEQGLGAVAAHSHMADLPRIIILYIFNIFAPVNILRYSYIFLNLILGPIGTYFFLQKIVIKNKTASFLGALFYLLNLGTMQIFAVPFEMFTTQYAFLPWLFLFATQYIYSSTRHPEFISGSRNPPRGLAISWRHKFGMTNRRKSLILFATVNLLSAPMAYAATLWHVNFLVILLYVGTISFSPLLNRNFLFLKKPAALILITLLVNSFWLLPNIYFVLTHGSDIAQANINKLFSPQAFLYNKEFGNIKDIALIKSFLFDWNIYAGNYRFESLLAPWIEHLKNPVIEIIGFLMSFVALAGLFYSFAKKNIIGLSLLPVLFLCLFFLINDNFPASGLYLFFQSKIPLFKEALRFPHDKVLGIFVFVFSIYFAFGQMFLVKIFSKSPKNLFKLSSFAQISVFTAMFIYFVLPAFKGNFISPYMRIKIPQNYFEMFSWFNKQEDGRTANLPIGSFWGWEYYDWYRSVNPSFQGAGFLWFGIKKPVLHRDFDRWSPYNEQYYREASYAIYTQNPGLLISVINKYQIKYILLDTSIVMPEVEPKVLFYEETKDILDKLDKQGFIEEQSTFGENLFVYKIKLNTNSNAYYTNDFVSIAPESKTLYEDFIYEKFGDYIIESNNLNNNSSFYPLRNIIDNQSRILSDIFSLTQQGINIKLPEKKAGNVFKLPSYLESEKFLSADLLIEKSGDSLDISLYPKLPVNDASNSPLHITAGATLPQNKIKNMVLSINRKDNFVLSEIPDKTPFLLDTVFLNTKEDNTISLYPEKQEQMVIPSFSNIKFSLNPCGETRQLFGIDFKDEKHGFALFGQNTPVCMIIPFKEIFSQGAEKNSQELLFKTQFIYQGDSSSNLCIARLNNGTCMDYISKNIFVKSALNLPAQYMGIKSEDFDNLGVKIFLDTSNSAEEKTAYYTNFSFGLTKPFFYANFSKDILEQSLEKINNENIRIKSINVPFSGNQQLNIDLTALPRTSGKCSNNFFVNLTKIEKQVITKGDNYIRYSSIEGALCDHFSYQNLSQESSYLVAITARNMTGLPLNICITNELTKRCDVYANLSKSKNFTTDIFLLAPMMNKNKGYDINISNLGIKGAPGINDLKFIQIIPFPYKWLSEIVEKQTGTVSKQNNLLILPQSYEDGWKAYRVNIKDQKSNIKNFFITTFPFIFGKELKEHVLVNNWSNGWVVNNSAIQQFNNSTIVLIFWPQYLEYAGFILLIGVFVWIIRGLKS